MFTATEADLNYLASTVAQAYFHSFVLSPNSMLVQVNPQSDANKTLAPARTTPQPTAQASQPNQPFCPRC